MILDIIEGPKKIYSARFSNITFTLQGEDVSLCGEEIGAWEELLLFVLLWYITGECRIVDAMCNGRMGIFTKCRFVDDINYGVVSRTHNCEALERISLKM